ncbi:hypothetical protein DOTSEDRAFT_49827 [Lecanosticta acicola]|uniref:WD40 repeat-like protein n=1 Tax=Lecanosticta acicola TaxID=111012 RepID=A0AAI8Z188_9PEZI|nr:hypothetical protein DOTSEDRAFT_49827 [Lecanosticta acicola]
MRDSLYTRIHARELNDPAVRSKSYRKLYTDRRLIDDLDIVNELDGHSGCVNALSWSKSGNLLASGSDDQHLNIHTYQPESTTNQFQLTATVATGHTQNIFSVKFMPHSNDRTVITAAGDAQVRIFDLEYAGAAGSASFALVNASEGRRRGRNNMYNGVRYLSDGDTNTRVYKSHGDRVKRIVTESSPYLFLTCSEDGEVRQWDLRQPSSAYPESRGSRLSSDSSVPTPLISYKRYSLDLNTISCSASQPHYIALGGAHLHAFLHDRRMTGRDRLREMGRALSPIGQMSAEEQEIMSQATQCVRKFAPKGQRRMKRADNGHITACKISDARPDEMIVSWSGDHIYSFDLVRDLPDEEETTGALNSHRAKESRDRKRKRKNNGSEASLAQDTRASSKPRTGATSSDAALRIRYQNGQSEDIPIPPRSQALTEKQRDAQRIAKATVNIRSSLFGQGEEGSDPSAQFTSALGHAASILGDIDETMRSWGYPMEPEVDQVYVQQTLRRLRERTRRFVQAAGTVARVLGGKLQTPSGYSPLMAQFSTIEVRSNDLVMPMREMFFYDFLKAILLWLDSGIGRLIEGFTRPSDMPQGAKAAGSLPIPEAEASSDAIDEFLIPYLLNWAGDDPIFNVEANRFETDESQQLFRSQKAAVLAFASAVKIPFEDLSSATVLSESSGGEGVRAQDRQIAHRYWARKVARSILLTVAEGLNYVTVDRCFGGLGRVVRELAAEEALVDVLGDDGEEEEGTSAMEVVDRNGDVVDGANAEDISAAAHATRHAESNGSPEEEMTDTPDEAEALLENERRHVRRPTFVLEEDEEDEHENEEDDDHDDDVDNGDDSDEDSETSNSSTEADEEDGVPNVGMPRYIYRSAVERRRLRPKVQPDVPCSRPTRTYRGHCNVRTVKDVNYFGPDDEYVVSGSDDGNFFIWDRKTSKLVNILEGDGEVVNVIQGHPYENMLAVSGIDHTIKVFSPDARAREVARLGQGVSAHDASSFSSIAWPIRIGHRPRPSERRAESETTSEPAAPLSSEEELEAAHENDDYVAPNGLSSRKRMHDSYRITQNNDVERGGGSQDAVITVRPSVLVRLLMARGMWPLPGVELEEGESSDEDFEI